MTESFFLNYYLKVYFFILHTNHGSTSHPSSCSPLHLTLSDDRLLMVNPLWENLELFIHTHTREHTCAHANTHTYSEGWSLKLILLEESGQKKVNERVREQAVKSQGEGAGWTQMVEDVFLQCCRWDGSHDSGQKMKSQDSNFDNQTPNYSVRRALRKGLKGAKGRKKCYIIMSKAKRSR